MNLLERVKNILLTPKTEWPVIAAEPSSVGSIFTGYLLLLAAIGPIFGFVWHLITSLLLSIGLFGISVHTSLVGAVIGMVLQYVATLGIFYVVALITDALAPSFGAQKNPLNAFKLVAYSATPGMVAGVLHLLPVMGSLLIFAASCYGVYLLYLGVKALYNVPEDKAWPYAIVVLVIHLFLGFIVALIVGAITAASLFATASSPSISFQTPNGKVSIDQNSLNEYGKRLEEANKKMEAAQKSNDPNAMAQAAANAMGAVTGAGTHTPIPAQELKAMLPEAVGDMKRESFEAQGGTAMGIANSTARASYRGGDKNVSVAITDIGGLNALAAFAGWMNMTQERETDTQIERTYKSGERTIHEQLNKQNGYVEVTYVLPSGVMVEAKGNGVDIDGAKKLIESLNLARLETVTKN